MKSLNPEFAIGFLLRRVTPLSGGVLLAKASSAYCSEYACGSFARRPCQPKDLLRLATKPIAKSGLKYLKIGAAICAFLFFMSVPPAFSEDPDMPEDESAQVELTMTVVKELPLPKGYHEGLFLEDGRMWVNNGENKNIWVVDLATGEVLSEITPPGHFTEGVTRSSDGAYWVSDWEDFRLYRADLSDGKLIANKNIAFAFAHPAGVVWTGNNFYILTWTRTLLGTKYHLLLLDKEGKTLLKMNMRGISGPSQLAWDGKSLWVTSWYGGRVFRIDPVAFKVTGYFNSPASDATGIAWDGTNFWITGTDSNLFCVKLGE